MINLLGRAYSSKLVTRKRVVEGAAAIPVRGLRGASRGEVFFGASVMAGV